jgi:hypothetical protein
MKTETRNKVLAIFLVAAMTISMVAFPVVATSAPDDDDDKGGTIVGGGSSSDTAEQHPSQYNDEGPYDSSNTFETDQLPPVNDDYEDEAKGTLSDFENIRAADGTATLSPSASGGVAVGFGTYNIPDNNFYTIGLNYQAPSNGNLYVTPVRPTGEPIDNSYKLTGNNDAVSNIQLSKTESNYLRNTGEMYLVLTACNAQDDFTVSEATLVSSQSEQDTRNYNAASALSKSQAACGTNEAPDQPTITISDADGDGTNEVGEQLTFTGSASDPDGDALTYNWEIEGNNANGQTTTETFNSRSTYTATLTVSDGEETSSVTKQFTVGSSNDNNAPENLQISVQDADSDGVNEVNEVLTFTGSASDPDGDALTYNWKIEAADVDGKQATQSFASTGAYTATLTVSDGEETASTQKTITVQQSNDNQAPVINGISISDEDGDGVDEVNELITFTGSASDPDGDALTYNWKIASLTSASGVSASETFGSPASYTVTLKVSDGELQSTQSETVTIQPDNDGGSDLRPGPSPVPAPSPVPGLDPIDRGGDDDDTKKVGGVCGVQIPFSSPVCPGGDGPTDEEGDKGVCGEEIPSEHHVCPGGGGTAGEEGDIGCSDVGPRGGTSPYTDCGVEVDKCGGGPQGGLNSISPEDCGPDGPGPTDDEPTDGSSKPDYTASGPVDWWSPGDSDNGGTGQDNVNSETAQEIHNCITKEDARKANSVTDGCGDPTGGYNGDDDCTNLFCSVSPPGTGTDSPLLHADSHIRGL